LIEDPLRKDRRESECKEFFIISIRSLPHSGVFAVVKIPVAKPQRIRSLSISIPTFVGTKYFSVNPASGKLSAHMVREGYYIRAVLHSFAERMFLGGLRERAENERKYGIPPCISLFSVSQASGNAVSANIRLEGD